MKTAEDQLSGPLQRLLMHAARHSPYYRSNDWAKKALLNGSAEFTNIPITSKTAMKADPASFHVEKVPEEDGIVVDKYTAGSSGEVSHIRKTALHFHINAAENARLKKGWMEKGWRIVGARAPTKLHPPGEVQVVGDKSNPRQWILHSLNPADLHRLIDEKQIESANIFPSQAISLLEYGNPLRSLRLISTIGEIVPPELKELLKRMPWCAHVDVYGSVETGIIAGLCKDCGKYHVADRHLLLELLDDDDKAVRPGVLGRVVVTPLFNLAMPLLRYEIGDYAVQSVHSKCRRSAFALDKIAGRQRNLFILPNGDRVAPSLPLSETNVLGIRRLKLVQTARNQIELRYIPEDKNSEISQKDAQGLIDRVFSPTIKAKAVKVEAFETTATGKYLLHECLISA